MEKNEVIIMKDLTRKCSNWFPSNKRPEIGYCSWSKTEDYMDAKYEKGNSYYMAECPSGYLCTRQEGHEGEHEAHLYDGKACARWVN